MNMIVFNHSIVSNLKKVLSPNQSKEIDRTCAIYPELMMINLLLKTWIDGYHKDNEK